MGRLIPAFLALGLVMAGACGVVHSDFTDAPPGSPDAPSSLDGAPGDGAALDGAVTDGASADAAVSDGAPPIDAPTDARTDAPTDARIDAVPTFCGDGIVNGSEQCDSGANNGNYGFCNSTCSGPGPRCGDSVQNGPEACDSGANNGSYGFCNASCTALGPRCGDGTTNGPEACDSGASNGQYGFCDASCSALGPRCGDSITNGPEQCDQATVYSSSMQAGVCRPDCAGTVQQKAIRVISQSVPPAQNGVGGMDNTCAQFFGSGYLALVVDGSSRVATVSPNAGDGQVNWVVGAYTRYVSTETNSLVFITDHTRLIGAAGGQDRDLYSPISTVDDGSGVWTGAGSDWTSGPDCNNWTSAQSTDFGLPCNATNTTGGTFPNNGGVSNCSYLRRVFCVQQ